MQNRIASRIGFALVSMALCSAAHALSFRAYLSVNGSDSNPCTVQLPCRLLTAALDAVVDGGEVWIVDSAHYNTATVNITKSVSILAIPGALGSVVALGGPAINIATASVNVSLRNLVITPYPAAGATSGIVMTNGSSLTIHETLIANVPTHGIDVNAAAEVKIMDSVIRDSGNIGVFLRGGARAEISNSKIAGNFSSGVNVYATAGTITTAAVNDSVISSSNGGLVAAAATGSWARLTAIRVAASNNRYGFICDGSDGSASCTVGYSMVTGTAPVFGYGFFSIGSATFLSMGNNIVIDNLANSVGTITPLAGS